MTENLYKLKTNIISNVCIVLQIYKCVIQFGYALEVAVAYLHLKEMNELLTKSSLSNPSPIIALPCHSVSHPSC